MPVTVDVALIACCPEHGLHGQRDRCFECGRPVEQVPMVPAEEAPGATPQLVGLARDFAILKHVAGRALAACKAAHLDSRGPVGDALRDLEGALGEKG